MPDFLSSPAKRSVDSVISFGFRRDGFVLVCGWADRNQQERFKREYDVALACSDAADVRVRDTTRANGLVNTWPGLDVLYCDPLLVGAAQHVVGGPVRLGSLLARTVNPGAAPQTLHRDNEPGGDPRAILAFILMIDDFTQANGATRFVPGSHSASFKAGAHPNSGDSSEVVATGPAGTLIIYDGNTLHGHGGNLTERGRRSVQGAFVDHAFTGWGALGARI